MGKAWRDNKAQRRSSLASDVSQPSPVCRESPKAGLTQEETQRHTVIKLTKVRQR